MKKICVVIYDVDESGAIKIGKNRVEIKGQNSKSPKTIAVRPEVTPLGD